ncbi:DUF4861 family protein [Aquimarina sp. W85]|uniref:DUF4861 family protein n=1 Tax=Aquimarina rhodophyticola TaxID=3342246 RepID=UPI00366C6AE6
MKPTKFLTILFYIAVIVACKSEKKEAAIIKDKNDTAKIEERISGPQTYAEISIAQGGSWNDRVYEGGTSFKNVTSLVVPKAHTDHSWYLRYEGPGWESNKVGYRLYLDWRNAIDIFGKVTDSLILPRIGQDGFDSYHEKQSWGQDILKVGKGLGIGSIGRLVDSKMLHFKNVDTTDVTIENTADMSSVIINYRGWKTNLENIDLTSTLSIAPNKRYTKHTFITSEAITGICTGIVDHGVNYQHKISNNKKWGYIATYGIQTLIPDKLGMAIFYKVDTTTDIKKGATDYLIEFKPATTPISFYFLGAWEQEKNGIKTEKEFLIYLDRLLKQLNETNTL